MQGHLRRIKTCGLFGHSEGVSMIKKLSDLPRISFQEFENRFEEILDNVEKKKMTYILMSNGKDSLALCPVAWVEHAEKELGFQRKEVEVSFEVEQDVYDKVQSICKKEGTTIEEVTVDFLYFCANTKIRRF